MRINNEKEMNKIRLYMCTNATFVSNSASVKGRMLYAPRMRLTPGYSSRPMSTNATPWKGISGFSSASYTNMRTHTSFHWNQRLTHQSWLNTPPFFVPTRFQFLNWFFNTNKHSRLTDLVSVAFVSDAPGFIISTGQSLFSVILCRSLKLQSTRTHMV